MEGDSAHIPPATFAELRRLGPDGNDYDRDVQVYLVGPISEGVESRIREELGYSTRAFRAADPIQLAEELDTWAAAVHADHPDEAVIVQFEDLDVALPAVAWNALGGMGSCSSKAKPSRRRPGALCGAAFAARQSIYLFGGETVMSRSVEREISNRRLPGRPSSRSITSGSQSESA